MTSSGDMFCGKWYDLNTNLAQRDWFSLWDCFYRWALSVILFYYCLITTPVKLLKFTYHYNTIWYGFWPGLVLTLYLPALPLAIIAAEMLKAFKKWATSTEDWSTKGPGSVFFVQPDSFFGRWLWAGHGTLAMYISIFCACGPDRDAIQASWEDTDTTKTYWRRLFEDSNVRYPREIGFWDGKSLDKKYKIDCSVVIKIENSYLGIGDAFLMYGKDFTTEQEIEDKLRKEYVGHEALVLELVQPHPEHGVHSLDILTFNTPEGPKILHCLVWTHCSGPSSHSTRGGYVVDVETETCVSPLGWYSAFFKQQPNDYVKQQFKIPGVKQACEQALRAHKNMSFKWCRMIGWDCMLTDQNEIVFFEGNFAGARLPRRFFLSWRHMWEAMKTCCWPFASKY